MVPRCDSTWYPMVPPKGGKAGEELVNTSARSLPGSSGVDRILGVPSVQQICWGYAGVITSVP